MKKYIILILLLGGALTVYATPSSTIINSVGGTFTTGSVLFGGSANEITQDNANLYYDDTNDYLGIGSTTPSARFAVTGAGTGTGRLVVIGDSANAERLTIFDNGKVGIGTSSPSVQLLNIQGGTAASTGNVGIRINNAQTTFSGTAQTEYQAFGTSTIFAVGLNNNASGANALDAFLMQQDSNDLYFGTNNVERVRIMSSGEFGIGTTSGSAKLAIKGTGTGTGRLMALSDSNNVETITILDNGKMGIGTTSPWRTLSGSGTLAWVGLSANVGAATASLCLSSTNEVTQNTENETCIASSERFKKDITEFVSADMLMWLKPITFRYKNEPQEVHFGFTAEQAAGVNRLLVSYDKEGLPSGIRWSHITTLLVKKVQQIVVQMTGLENRIQTLETRLNKLEKK